jgi:hypothetical protein
LAPGAFAEWRRDRHLETREGDERGDSFRGPGAKLLRVRSAGTGKTTRMAATLLPLLMGFMVCFLVAQVWRLGAGA